MDRTIVTGMVEDYWRTMLPIMQTGNVDGVTLVGQRFEQRVEETAKLMPPLESAAFRQTVDAERERMMAEYTAHPIALKRRLGVALGVDAPRQRRARGGDDLGRLAVRTAVRATVWESIWALFRVAR